MLDTNGIECLPEEVREKYEITDCHVYIDLTEKLVQKWTDLIVTTLKDIELRETDYKETHSDKCFWDDEESVNKQSYYYANLCSYSANKLLPYKAYLEKLEAAQSGDIFGSINNSISNNKVITDEDPLAWLNDI